MASRPGVARHLVRAGVGAGGPERLRRLALVAAAATLVLLVGWPLVELVLAAAARGWSGVRDAFRGALAPSLNTLWLGVVVTPLAVVGGTAAALVTERQPVPGRQLLRGGVLLAFLVPPYVTAQSWASAYGPAGLLDDLTGLALPGTFGPVGVVVVLVVHAVPLAYLVVAAGLASRAEPDLARAARAAGAGAWTTLRTVTLPVLREALIAAAALVFVITINAFGVPAILGLPGNFLTLTTRIYRDLSLSADPAAFTRVLVLATALVLLAVVAVGVADLLGALRSDVVRTGAPGGGRPPAGRRSWLPAVVLGAAVVVTVLVPLAALVLRALTRGVGMPPWPGNWTLAHFEAALSGQALEAFGNSLVLAVLAATAVLVLGGLLTAVRRTRLGRAFGTGAILTFAVPGSTLAVAVLLAYGGWFRDTLLLILLAYVAKLWAVGHRVVVGSADTLPAEVGRAARASGAGGLTTLRTVITPLLWPAMAAAWLLVFVTALHELTMSSLLYGPGTETVAVVILNAQQLGNVSVTSAMAVLLTLALLVGTAPLLALRRAR